MPYNQPPLSQGCLLPGEAVGRRALGARFSGRCSALKPSGPAETTLCLPGVGRRSWPTPPLHPLGTPGCWAVAGGWQEPACAPSPLSPALLLNQVELKSNSPPAAGWGALGCGPPSPWRGRAGSPSWTLDTHCDFGFVFFFVIINSNGLFIQIPNKTKFEAPPG